LVLVLDGDTGKKSPFTRALIAHIARPGVEIQQAMTEVRAQVSEETKKRQLPWGHTNLIGSVYLNPAELPSPLRRPARLWRLLRDRAAAMSNSSSGARSRTQTRRKSSTHI